MNTIDNQARAIFLDVIDQPTPERGAEFLDVACGDDLELRAHVERLLRSHELLGSFHDAPPFQVTADQPKERIGTTLGPYKLLEQIGEGGMGVVYMAQQTQPVKRKVALKVIKPGMDSRQVIARFEAERQALAMMDHPHIARVLDAGTTDSSRPYFVMELVRGVPITDYCNKQRLNARDRLKLFLDVCHAVQHAHLKGIIHRDLKPSNVLVTLHDGTPVVKVIDFGVAKALNQELTEKTLFTQFSQMVGTPLYMSPEQAELSGLDVDTRTDVYSLGVLLYELLTGTTPFDKERLKNAGFDEMRRIIREDEPPRPSTRISTLRAAGESTAAGTRGSDPRQLSRLLRDEIDWIVMKSLEKDRSRRYESASALATDIQRYLSDEPVLACPPTTMYRFQKFARKHKPALATAAAIAACLILGTTVSAWQAVRATTAESQANANEVQAKEAAAAEAQQRQRAEANEQKAVANAAAAEQKEQEAIKQRDEVKGLNEKLAAKEQQLQRTLYAAHMNLAQQAWEAGRTGGAAQLLLQHRPKAGEPDLRSFEWHYLLRLCHSDLPMLRGHTARVNSVIFSPDGRRLATASADRTVKLWDAETGKELRTLKGHTGAVDSVAFSPDGKRLASCTGYDAPGFYTEPGGLGLKVWNVETGEELLYMPEAYSPVSYSADGKGLATTYWSGGNRIVKVWDAETGRELVAWKAHDKNIKRLAFSPDGKSLASADGATAKMWNAQTGQELLSLQGTGYYGLNFSPDGKRLVTAGGDGWARVWDTQTGEKVSEKLLSLKGVANFVTLSPDGKHLAAEPDWDDPTAYIFDLQTGKEVRTIKGAKEKLSYSPDGRRLASVSSSIVQIWDVEKDQRNLVIRPTNRWYVAMSPDGKFVASGSGLNVMVWDARTGQPSLTLKGHTVPVFGVAFSPDGKRIVSGGFGRLYPGGYTGQEAGDPTEVRIWDAQTGQELLAIKGQAAVEPRATTEVVTAGEVVFGVAFSPDGKRVASAQKVWDAQTGQEIFSLINTKNLRGNPGVSVAFSPDGKYLASSDFDGAKLWNAQTGQEIRTLAGVARRSHFCPVVAFSQDSKRLAGGGFLGTLKVWDVESGKEVLALVDSGRFAFAFSPDGKRLVSNHKIWDAETGQELLSLDGGSYGGIAFSPDGHRMVGNTGEMLKIYDATPLPERP